MAEISVTVDYEAIGTQHTLEAVNNASWQQTFALVYQDQPFLLDEYDAKMQLRPSDDSDEVRLELSTDNGLLRKLQTGGRLQVLVGIDRMVGVPAGSYVYDLVLTAGGIALRLVYGTVVVTQGVTR